MKPHIAAGLMGAFLSPIVFMVTLGIFSPNTHTTEHFWGAVVVAGFLLSWVISNVTSRVSAK